MRHFFKIYLLVLPRIIFLSLVLFVDLLKDVVISAKKALLQRMFWGRGSLYKSSFHLFVAIITVGVLASGLGNKINTLAASNDLAANFEALATAEIGSQGNNLTSVVPISTNALNYQVREYTIAEGDTLQAIADKFGVSKDTVKWSNNKILSPFNDAAPVGAKLKIPEINGVLYQTSDKDTLDSVLALTSGDRKTVIDINELNGPGYRVANSLVFVPNGKLPPPPPQIIARSRPTSGYIASNRAGAGLGNLPAGTFDDPLSHPQCAGYRFSRGISSYHSGVDLSKAGGCPIRAIGAGRVVAAGWRRDGAGYAVTIDHGSGIRSLYYHGDGNIWVKAGDYVQKGQDIMYMGNTGNSFGTHLHLTLTFNGQLVDPQPYVPYSLRR